MDEVHFALYGTERTARGAQYRLHTMRGSPRDPGVTQ